MRFPGWRFFTSRFRPTSQLAHMSAKDVHEMQYRLREMHREFGGIKHGLKEISSLSKGLPKGEHHNIMEKIFTHVDSFNESVKRHEKHMHHLQEYIEGFEKNLKELEKE